MTKDKRENRFTFDVEGFRKITFTGLGLNYHSYTFTNFKISNIKTLILELIDYVAVGKIFTETDFLLKCFKPNGYPDSIISNASNRFLTSTFKDKTNVATAQKLILHISSFK